MGRAITFVDVETTGLTREDRVVSLGLLEYLDEEKFRSGEEPDHVAHLIFNPQRPSHPRARAVHGYADDVLAVQDLFAIHADDIWERLDHGGKVVAHNASFDRRFIETEMVASGRTRRHPEYHCTMLAHRRKYGSRSGLDAVLGQMGLQKRGVRHGALEDAWLSAQVYGWLNGFAPILPAQLSSRPTNLRSATGQTAVILNSERIEPIHPKTSPLVQALQDELMPMATVMMSIARADGEFSNDEVDVLAIFMESRIGGRLDLSEAEKGDILAALVDADVSSGGIDAACAAIVASEADAAQVAHWVRQVTFADGQGSAAEGKAISRVIESVRAAKRKT